MASPYEMYASDYINTGNPNIDGESTNSYEFGIEIYGSAIKMNISQLVSVFNLKCPLIK